MNQTKAIINHVKQITLASLEAINPAGLAKVQESVSDTIAEKVQMELYKNYGNTSENPVRCTFESQLFPIMHTETGVETKSIEVARIAEKEVGFYLKCIHIAAPVITNAVKDIDALRNVALPEVAVIHYAPAPAILSYLARTLAESQIPYTISNTKARLTTCDFVADTENLQKFKNLSPKVAPLKTMLEDCTDTEINNAWRLIVTMPTTPRIQRDLSGPIHFRTQHIALAIVELLSEDTSVIIKGTYGSTQEYRDLLKALRYILVTMVASTHTAVVKADEKNLVIIDVHKASDINPHNDVFVDYHKMLQRFLGEQATVAVLVSSGYEKAQLITEFSLYGLAVISGGTTLKATDIPAMLDRLYEKEHAHKLQLADRAIKTFVSDASRMYREVLTELLTTLPIKDDIVKEDRFVSKFVRELTTDEISNQPAYIINKFLKCILIDTNYGEYFTAYNTSLKLVQDADVAVVYATIDLTVKSLLTGLEQVK